MPAVVFGTLELGAVEACTQISLDGLGIEPPEGNPPPLSLNSPTALAEQTCLPDSVPVAEFANGAKVEDVGGEGVSKLNQE